MPKKKVYYSFKDKNGDTVELNQEEFALVNAYFDNNMNQTQAYLEVHPRTAYDSARVKASQAFSKVNIFAEIDRRLTENAMSANEVVSRITDIARVSQRPFIKIDEEGFVYFNFNNDDAKRNLHLIKKIKSRKKEFASDNGESLEKWVEVELHDAHKALETLGKYYKLDKEPDDNKSDTVEMVSIPINLIAPDFKDVYDDIQAKNHLEYLFRGGRGSTKSSFVALVFIETFIKPENKNIHGLALRQVANTLRDSVYNQLRWAIFALGLDDKFKSTVNPLEIEYIPTGQKIYFRGGDDPVKIKSITPPFGYIGILWLEELDQFKGQEAVRNIEQSAIRGGDIAWIFKSFNPPRTAASWVNKYAKIPKENQYNHFSNYLGLPEDYFADEDLRKSLPYEFWKKQFIEKRRVPNSWLGKPWLDEAEHLLEVNPTAYYHEYGGIATGTGGLVFENVIIREITDDEIAQFDRILFGLDWGYYPDPFSWGKMYYDAARLTLYIFDEYRDWKKSNLQTFQKFYWTKDEKGKIIKLGEKEMSVNDLMIADSAEPKSIADYREYGANIRGAEKGPDSISYSMKWLQSLKAIVIDDRRAPHHAEEFLNYEFEQNKDGEFISSYPDKNNHAIDDVRYATNLIWRVRGQ